MRVFAIVLLASFALCVSGLTIGFTSELFSDATCETMIQENGIYQGFDNCEDAIDQTNFVCDTIKDCWINSTNSVAYTTCIGADSSKKVEYASHSGTQVEFIKYDGDACGSEHTSTEEYLDLYQCEQVQDKNGACNDMYVKRFYDSGASAVVASAILLFVATLF